MGLNQAYREDFDPSAGGGDYLDEGIHDVRVESYSLLTSSTPGVKFIVADQDGNICRGTFWLTEKAMVRLASFAKACGLNDQEMINYDPSNANCHQALVGRPLTVEVKLQKDSDKFHEIANWKPRAAGQVPTPQIAKPPEPDIIDTALDADIPF